MNHSSSRQRLVALIFVLNMRDWSEVELDEVRDIISSATLLPGDAAGRHALEMYRLYRPWDGEMPLTREDDSLWVSMMCA